ASTQPTTNAARRPNASRAYTYFPPACGRRAASSAKTRVPRNASAPPSTQATNVRIGRPSWRATIPGVRKIPDPTMIPTIIASPSAVRSVRLSRVIADQVVIQDILWQLARSGRSEASAFGLSRATRPCQDSFLAWLLLPSAQLGDFRVNAHACGADECIRPGSV